MHRVTRPSDGVVDVARLPAFLADRSLEPGVSALVGGHVVDRPGRRSVEPLTVLIREGRIAGLAGPDDGMPDGASLLGRPASVDRQDRAGNHRRRR